jgi:hypothetical protein
VSEVTNYSVTFFDPRVTVPPATSTRKLSGTNLRSAVLNWDIDFYAAKFQSIMFNGHVVSTKAKGSADVTHLIVLNSNNTVRLEYARNSWNIVGPIAVTRDAGVKLDVVAFGVTQQVASNPSGGFKLPSWGWGVVAVIVLLVLLWFLFATPNGKKFVTVIKDTGRSVAKTVGGT